MKNRQKKKKKVDELKPDLGVAQHCGRGVRDCSEVVETLAEGGVDLGEEPESAARLLLEACCLALVEGNVVEDKDLRLGAVVEGGEAPTDEVIVSASGGSEVKLDERERTVEDMRWSEK